jgi:hypothetical protein
VKETLAPGLKIRRVVSWKRFDGHFMCGGVTTSMRGLKRYVVPQLRALEVSWDVVELKMVSDLGLSVLFINHEKNKRGGTDGKRGG